MSVLWLALVVAWTYVFSRIVGLRVTLSTRTLLGFIAAGMIYGPLAIAVTGIFVNPYGWRCQDQTNTQVTVNVLSFILAHAIVAAPILYIVAIRGRYRAISIADAFTCGFLFGFGAHLMSIASAAQAPQGQELGVNALIDVRHVANPNRRRKTL